MMDWPKNRKLIIHKVLHFYHYKDILDIGLSDKDKEQYDNLINTRLYRDRGIKISNSISKYK
jgi:hypothetical protein